jgi:hypothetical protein
MPFDNLASWWKRRWLLERANRIDDWKLWKREQIAQIIMVEGLK